MLNSGRHTDRNGAPINGQILTTARDEYSGKKDVRPCELCHRSGLEEGDRKYNPEFGGILCNSCNKDFKKKPCSECFTIHNGECM